MKFDLINVGIKLFLEIGSSQLIILSFYNLKFMMILIEN
jgi:hypothetical protein